MLIIIIFAIFILSYQLSTRNELKFNEVFIEQLDQPFHYYFLHLNEKDDLSDFIQFSTVSKSNDNTANIFISKTTQYPSFIDSDYQTYTRKLNIIILSKDYYEKAQVLYIGIACDSNCEYNITANQTETMTMQLNRDIVFSVLGDKNQKHILYSFPNVKPALLYAISPGKFEFSLNISIDDSETGQKHEIIPDEVYDNGYGVLITTMSLNSKMTIKITGYKTTVVTIGSRRILRKKMKNVQALEVVYGEIKYPLITEECFSFIPNANAKSNANYLINILSFTEDILFSYSNDKDEKSEEILTKNTYNALMNSSKTNRYILCFTATEPIETGKLNDVSGFTFQILNSDELYESQLYLRPLINGRTSSGYLPPKGILIHRLEKGLKDKKVTEIFVKQDNNDLLSAYGVSCRIFPDCQYTQEKIKNSQQIIEPHIINDLLHITLNSMNPIDANLYIAIIHCNSIKPCKYSISMKNEDDFIILPTRKTYYKAVNIGSIDKYTFRYYNLKTKYLFIRFLSITGKGELSIYDKIEMEKKKGKYSLFGKCEIYFLETNFLFKNTYDFYITVNGISNSYYSLIVFDYEYIYQNTVIPSGGKFIEQMSNRYWDKTFVFHPNEKEDHSKGFLISLSMITCNNINFKYKTDSNESGSGSKDSSNNAQFYFEYNDNDDKKVCEINASFDKLNPNYDYITSQILISSTDISPHKQILLIEGYQHVDSFLKYFEEITYNYPYFYVGYEENLVISITANGPMEYSYSTGKDEGIGKYMFTYEMNELLIPSHQLEKDCFVGYVCSIIIKVRRNKAESNIDELQPIKYSIQVTATNLIPIYLIKDKLRLDHVFEGNTLHYYTEIKEYEEGEIMINFLKGSGYAIAKIVSKDKIEEDANWNHRVRLPDKDEKNRLPNDYFKNKITYDKSHTENCTRGCELYLTVFSTEEESTLFSSFSILIRNLTGFHNVSILLNQYYFGSLLKDESNKYQIKLADDYKSLFFDFNTEICRINITENDVKNSPQALIFYSSFTLKASDFGRSTFKSMTLIITIYTQDVLQYFSSYNYNLRVIPPIEDSKLEIIELDYIHNRYCDIKEEQKEKLCRYVIKIHEYDYLTNNLLVAFQSNPQRLVKIYATRTTESMYNLFTRKMVELAFSTTSEYEVLSNNSTLLSEPDPHFSLITATYAFVIVESTSQGKILLVSNWGHFPKKTLLIPNTLLVFYITKNREMEVIIQGKSSYQCQITWITGGGFVEKYTDSGIYQQEINSLNQSVNILIDPIDEDLDNKNNIIKIKSNEKGLGYSIYYSMRGPENLDQAKMFLYSYYFYNIPTEFPLFFYTQIYDISKDIITNIYIEDDLNIPNNEVIDYSLTTTFDKTDDTLKFRKDSSSPEHVNSTVFEGAFNSYFKTVYSKVKRIVNIKQQMLISYDHFIINKIGSKALIKSKQKHIKLKTLFMPLQLSDDIPLNETKPFPYNTFIISTLDNISNNEFILGSFEDIGKYMEIELITDANKIDIDIIAVKNHTDIPSEIDMITFDYNSIEKVTISLKLLPDEFGVKLDFKSKINKWDLDILPYALRYKLSSLPFQHCKLKSNGIKIDSYTNNSTKITFTNIQNDKKQFVQAKFDIMFYNYSSYNRNLTNSEKAMLLLTDFPLKKYTIYAEVNKSTIQYKINEIPPGKYYVSIIGATNHYLHEELFQYNVTYIELTSKGMEYLWIIFPVFIVVIAIAVCIAYCINKKSQSGSFISNANESSSLQYQTLTNTNTNSNSNLNLEKHSKEE